MKRAVSVASAGTDGAEIVARVRGLESARLEHNLFARTARGGKRMTGTALVLIEEWAYALFRGEDVIEQSFAGPKPCQLRCCQPGQRLAGIRGAFGPAATVQRRQQKQHGHTNR